MMGEFCRDQGISKHGMFKTDLSSSKPVELEGEIGQTTRELVCHAKELELCPHSKEEHLKGWKQPDSD